jgi:hypothetical protein
MVKEESLLLRSLVLMLASIAIISFDLGIGSSFSYGIIPLCAIGSLWSYICRHLDKNLLIHLALLGFVSILSYYWISAGQFDNSSWATRSWIAPIAFSLIVQTLALWLAYYRFVLSSSVMISSCQMIGAVLLADKLIFLLPLILFLLCLVITLFLIYRSTINLPPIGLSIWSIPGQLNERNLPWLYLLKIIAITLIGGSFFALFISTSQPIFFAHFPGSEQSKTQAKPDTKLTTKQTHQAMQNILATADRPLNTSSERIEYVTNYLQDHAQPGTCQEKDGCTQEFRQQLEQLAVPCSGNNQQCQKDWKFVADQQELAAVYDQLARSITSEDTKEAVPSLSNLPTNNELAKASPAPLSSSTIEAPIAPTSQPAPTPNINNISVSSTSPPAKVDYNPDTNKYEIAPPSATISNESLSNSETTPQNQPLAPSSSPASSNNKTAIPATLGTNSGANNGNNSQMPNEVSQPQSQSNQSSKEAQANKADKVAPPPRPSKNQWLNFLSVILLVFLVLGTIWYFQRQQLPDEKAVMRKKLKSKEPMSIEQIYEFMLQELRLGGKVKLPYVTESEFARLIKLYYPGALSKVIAEISGDYVAWRYGQQPANEVITQQNFKLFCQLHNSMQSAKLGKNSSKSTRKT